MACVSIKNHKYAAINPKAQFYGKYGDLKVEDVLNSRMICSPLTLLDCCPMTDGGNAVIIAEEKFAKDRIDTPSTCSALDKPQAGPSSGRRRT